MSTSVAGLKTAPGFVLVDGNKVLQHRFMERFPVRLSDFARQVPSDLKNAAAVVKGDAKSYAIAAASIIAKVTRDRIMAAEHKKYPVSLDAQCSFGGALQRGGRLLKFAHTRDRCTGSTSTKDTRFRRTLRPSRSTGRGACFCTLLQLQPLCTVLSLTRRAPRACLAQRHPPHDVRPHEAHEKMRGHMVIVGAFCIVATIAPVTIIA